MTGPRGRETLEVTDTCDYYDIGSPSHEEQTHKPGNMGGRSGEQMQTHVAEALPPAMRTRWPVQPPRGVTKHRE